MILTFFRWNGARSSEGLAALKGSGQTVILGGS